MRHRIGTVKLGRTASHRKAMLRNMVTSLLREERIETTLPRAKECRRFAERMITFAKRGDLHARRQAGRMVRDNVVLKKLFDELGPRFLERKGGYTRILKTGFRAGDNAEMSYLELLPDAKALARKAEEAAAAAAEAKGKGGKGKKKDGSGKPEKIKGEKGEKVKERATRRTSAPRPAKTAGGRKAPRKASKRGD